MTAPDLPTFEDVRGAMDRIRPFVHRTPVLTSRQLNGVTGADLFFKCENLQRVGAFKIRGATNAVMSLGDEEAKRGVATHSSGNHAAALAQAARWRGIRAQVVMPETSPKVKVEAVRGYGAEVTFCEPTLEARESTLSDLVQQSGATFIHPYNDPRVIAGQGTAAMELLTQAGPMNMVIVPVGGGGLASGTCLAARGLSPKTLVVGGEPAGADDAARSLEAGELIPSVDPDTVADGLLTSLGARTFAILTEHIHSIRRVDDAAILRAMRLIWERMKLVVEPSAAVPLAVALTHPDLVRGKRIGLVLSGGNVNLDRLPWQE